MSIINNIVTKANEYLSKENIDSAIEIYISALNINISKKDKHKINYTLGLLYYDKGLLDYADKCFNQSTTDQYNVSDSLNYRGIIAKINGDVNLAKSYYTLALKKDSKNAFAINNLANILITTGENTKAKELLIKATNIEKNNPIPQYNLVKFAQNNNDAQLEEFVQEYIKRSLTQIYFLEKEGKINRLKPQSEQDTIVSKYLQSINEHNLMKSKFLFDSIIIESGKLKNFDRKTRKAIGSVHARKANILLELNEFKLAINEYEHSINYLGLKPSILVNMGICLNKLDKTDTAIKYFNKINKSNDVSNLIAKCTLAKIAFDENTRKTFKLKEPKEYFNFVLKNLKEKNFNQIDNSRFQISEAIIEGTNSEKCFVFRRAPTNSTTKQIFEKEEEALKKFYYSSKNLKINLNVVRPLGIVQNVRGYDSIILTRGRGNNVLEELIRLKKEKNNDEIESIFNQLSQEFVKIRIIGNYSCKNLTDKLHSENTESNITLYQNLIKSKFIGNKEYSGSIYNITTPKISEAIISSINQDYNIIAKILATQNSDFYKDMSLKNILISNHNYVHIDFETIRNFPFALDVATAINMGDFVKDKDSLAKKIYDKNTQLSSVYNLDANLKTLEEFTIALHAAGVQRGLTHHASFTDWNTRLKKEEYKNLAKDSLNNTIKDLTWLKENGQFTNLEKNKIYLLYNLLSEIYN